MSLYKSLIGPVCRTEGPEEAQIDFARPQTCRKCDVVQIKDGSFPPQTEPLQNPFVTPPRPLLLKGLGAVLLVCTRGHCCLELSYNESYREPGEEPELNSTRRFENYIKRDGLDTRVSVHFKQILVFHL